MFVLFNHDNDKPRYYVQFGTSEAAYHFADCLRYCNHIHKFYSVFNHIKVKNDNMSLKGLKPVVDSYITKVYNWIKRGYIN